ncbi:acyl-coenzyme A synthetase ACSM3, mitochondrial [Trichonephila clavata]|uniref:medium-chain acyl-CoA ligase n=1 Tax=Trichonephila clavata TaxID=2740835 RepID=A0A8X6I802_TRICU|nr:acyl-coenzyme A synthetase ACSM3, mitochondrial [Trichonephila clavata]
MKLRAISCVFYRLKNGYFVSGKILCFNRSFSKLPFRCLSSVSRSGFNDYYKERLSFNVEIPEKFNFASDVIDVWARKEREGERKTTVPAFWFVFENGKEIKWDFQTIEYETKRVANMLQEKLGIKRGDNVMVMLPKIPEFWLVNVAAIRIGAVLSPASMMLTVKDLSYRFPSFKPTCIIAHDSVVDLIDQVSSPFTPKTKVIVSGSEKRKDGWLDFHRLQKNVSANHKCAETRSDESMMVFFTSGTTGLPKMAEHSHASYGLGHLSTARHWHDLTSDCILWNLSDTGWAKTAYSTLFSPWLSGSCVFIHEMPRFSTSLTLQILAKYPIDTFCAPPTAFRELVQENLKAYKFPKLEHCVGGGEALNPEVLKSWEDGTGLKIYEGYGQTEMVIAIGTFRCIEHKPGSLGKPAPTLDVVILDENENELGPGITGEIALKKRNGKIFGLFLGYKDDPEKTKKALTENYFHTGDLAYYDDDGYFWFVGRNDDIINSAGYRIGPFEVESAIMEHPDVVEVAVTSSPDKKRGEVVKAFVVLKDYPESEELKSELIKELQEHTKRTTAPYKYPRKVEFVKELPKTVSGKIKRFELKEKEWKS